VDALIMALASLLAERFTPAEVCEVVSEPLARCVVEMRELAARRGFSGLSHMRKN
jgi:hypothetical protein